MNGAIEGGEAVMPFGVDIRFLLRKDTTTGPPDDDMFIGDWVMENGHLTQNGNTFTLDCTEYGGDHYHVGRSKWPGTGDDGATWTPRDYEPEERKSSGFKPVILKNPEPPF